MLFGAYLYFSIGDLKYTVIKLNIFTIVRISLKYIYEENLRVYFHSI